jgi:hypothetical protein
LHVKGLRCARIGQTLRQMGTGEDQELAVIVPRRYCIGGIWVRQEESA